MSCLLMKQVLPDDMQEHAKIEKIEEEKVGVSYFHPLDSIFKPIFYTP